MAWSPPQTLPASRDLNRLEVERRVGVQETKLIDDRRMDRKLRGRHVDRANRLLNRLTVGGKRRRVLILAAHIERHRPRRTRRRSPAHQVRTLAVETAIVVGEGLAKVITVVERGARDAGVARVNAVYSNLGSIGTVEASEIAREFGFKRCVEPVYLGRTIVARPEVVGAKIVNAKIINAKIIVGSSDDSSALHARPWPQVGEGARRVTQRGQTVERRINPAVQGNGGRSEFGRSTDAPRRVFLEIAFENVPARSRQIRVVVCAVLVPPDQIAEGATNNYVRGEMLSGRDPRKTDSRGRAIGQQFG